MCAVWGWRLMDLTEYQERPVEFCREVLGVEPWSKQEEVLLAVRDHPKTTVRACHGVGKSFISAAAILWRLHCFSPSVVLTTAPSHRQVKDVLWRRIRTLQKRAREGLPGEVRETVIKISEDTFALGFATDEGDRFQGFHCEHLFIVVEEASGVGDMIFEAIDGCLTNRGTKLLLIGNPLRPSGRFYYSFERGSWRRVHISAYDSPNLVEAHLPVTAGVGWRGDPTDPEQVLWPDPKVKELVDVKWVVDLGDTWGYDSSVFKSRALGEFPDACDDQLIALSWVEEAENRYLCWEENKRKTAHQLANDSGAVTDPSESLLTNLDCMNSPGPASLTPGTGPGGAPPHSRGFPGAPAPTDFPEAYDGQWPEVGIDVARYGDCENVLCVRYGDLVPPMTSWRGVDLMATTGRIVTLLRPMGRAKVRVDVVGMGGGVYDRMAELQRMGDLPAGFQLLQFVGGGAPVVKAKQYRNRRDEAFFQLRERFKSGRIMLAPDPVLRQQLTSLRYSFMSDGRLTVESKEEMRGRGERSPDRADALAESFVPDGEGVVGAALVGRGRPDVAGMSGLLAAGDAGRRHPASGSCATGRRERGGA